MVGNLQTSNMKHVKNAFMFQQVNFSLKYNTFFTNVITADEQYWQRKAYLIFAVRNKLLY